MTSDSSKPLDGTEPESVTLNDIDDEAVRDALTSDNPLVRQRGIELCDSLATQRPDAVEPFLDIVAAATADDNVAVSVRAIGVLDTVAGHAPGRLDGRLDDVANSLDSDLVDVQRAGGDLFATLIVERPVLVAPYLHDIIDAIATTELDENPPNFGEVVSDPVTRQTLETHEQSERSQRLSSRRTLANVVVAVTETDPDAAVDSIGELVTLVEDVDPTVVGCAIDALGEIAASRPDAVTPVSSRLVDCLDHTHDFVRARTVRALGYLGDSSAIPALRDVANTDDNENVRELAAETANYLDELEAN